MMCPRGLFLMAVAATTLGCGSGGGFPDAPEIDAPLPPGTFTLDWSVTNTNNDVISCDSIGAQSVTVLLRNRGVQGGSTEVFTCPTLEGTSQGLAPGIYDLNFELVGSGGPQPTGVIATSPAQMAIEIKSGENVRLSPLTFVVDATGGLELNLSTNTLGGNCAATAQDGAGITTMTLTLEHASDASCEPVTFNVSAGATGTAGTYTVDCATPVAVPCLAADQQLTVAGVPSGSYVVRVRGYKDAAACWTNNDTLPVPPLGRDLTRTLNLAFQTGTIGC